MTSAEKYVPEVAKIPINQGMVNYLAGMIKLKVETTYQINYNGLSPQPLPMFGFSIYEAPGAMMAFPIIPEQKIFCISSGCYIVGSNISSVSTVY